MDLQAFSFILLLGSLFGSATIASRYCIGQFSPVTYSALRFSLATLGYALFYIFKIKGRRLPTDRQLWKHCVITGILGNSLPVLLIVSSLEYLSSGVTATMVTIFPVIVVVLAHFMLHDEPFTRRKALGVILALSGAVLIVILGETGLPGVGQANPVGYLMILAAALISGFTTIYVRKHMVQYTAFEVTSLRLFFATLFLLPLAFILDGFDLSRVNLTGYIVSIFASLILFVGFFLGFFVIQRFGVTIAAMADYIPPIIASLGGALLLDEKITPGMLAGMGLILGGVAVINLKRKRMPPAKVHAVVQPTGKN